jgi:hypothetical protein
MGSELEINYGIAKVRVSLAEFATAIKQISGAVKHEEVRQALKDMIKEVRKSYDTTVDVFTPFYDMDTRNKFVHKFSEQRGNFKNNYLKRTNEVRSHCDKVKYLIEELKKRKGWMKNLPLAKKSFKRLLEVGEFWFMSDYALSDEMETFLNRTNEFLNDIHRIKRKSPENAFLHLQSGLEQFEDDFKSVKKYLDALDAVSNRL